MPTASDEARNYQRHLISVAHGFPCYGLPVNSTRDRFSERGFCPGDLVYSSKQFPGITLFVLNVFESKDHSARSLGAGMPDFQPAAELKQSDILTQTSFFKTDTWLTSTGVHEVSSDSPKVKHAFTCPSGHGAILGLPVGADRQDLVQHDFLLGYIRKYAKEWYNVVLKHMVDPIDDILNGSLFLITGVDKTTQYCGVSFVKEKRTSVKERGIQILEDDGAEWLYAFEGCPNVEHTPKVTNEETPMQMAVTVRGYSIAISPGDWNELRSRWKRDPEPQLHSVDPRTLPYRISAWASEASSDGGDLWIPPLSVYQPLLPQRLPAHLSRIMLQRILPFIPPNSVAVVHDQAWIPEVKKMTSAKIRKLILGDLNIFADKILDRYKMVLDNGLVFLKSRECPRKQSAIEWSVNRLIRLISWREHTNLTTFDVLRSRTSSEFGELH